MVSTKHSLSNLFFFLQHPLVDTSFRSRHLAKLQERLLKDYVCILCLCIMEKCNLTLDCHLGSA